MPDPEVSDADDLRATLSDAFDAAPEVETPVTQEPVEVETQPRDPVTGKFVLKEPATVEKTVTEAVEPTKAAEAKPLEPSKVEEQPKQPDAPVVATATPPPPGWSVAAKQEWEKLPQPVREAVAKRETEVNQGLAKLQDYRALEPFERLAAQSGTTLPQAFERYVAAEQFLTREPIKGLLWLCQQYGVDPAALSGGKSEPGAAPVAPGANGHQPPLRDPEVLELRQKLSALESTIVGQSQSAVKSELTNFEGEKSPDGKLRHPFFENVRVEMGALMQAGKATSLDTAYEMACWANPEVRAALINERDTKAKETAITAQAEAASKAKLASKSVAGAPEGNSSSSAPTRSLREEISAAFE